MKAHTEDRLMERNKRIIDAVVSRTKAECPDSVAIIGVVGSFRSGEFHERSDLDLCIVTNDDGAQRLMRCFILEGIGYDIYGTPWQKLEKMADYPDPHVANLLDMDIVYQRSEAELARYLSLRDTIAKRLAAPFSVEDAKVMNRHLESAMKEYASVMLADDVGACKYASVRMLVYLEYVVYTANKSYIRRGVRRISEEIAAMKSLPEGFIDDRGRLIRSRVLQEIKTGSTTVMAAASKFVSGLAAGVAKRRQAEAADLRGSYEEIVSNWRNKMHLAAETDDEYLALVSMAACQELYDDLGTEFDIDALRLFGDSDYGDLRALAREFDNTLDRFRENYDKCSLPVRVYDTIAAFERDYRDAGSRP